MVWCSYCGKDQQAERDDINGFTCCTGCGRVLDDNVYGSDPTFTKTAGGQSQVEGNFVKDGQNSFGRLGAGAGRILGYQSDSHEKTLAKGKHEIVEILERLSIRPRDDTATQAHRFYTIALERNFTRGRRTQQVAASCIYIVCRQNNKPYMLIDFSDCLQTNVYILGAVFLQLCNLLRLEEQPFMQKPVDPSLFIHRFADRLRFGKKMHAVSNTALRLVASMKRDWMQTGRRPSGICGAALFISAHMHGFERSKGDVVSVVHICEATLKRRLVEFECTESGSLTAEEFEVKGQEMEEQIKAAVHCSSSNGSKAITEILCEHKDTGTAHFSHGLCQSCYEEFVRVSGGMQGGSAPPAFQRAELQRMQVVRDQLKIQGLNSDEEEEARIPTQSLRRAKQEVRLGGKAMDLTPVIVADSDDLPPTGRGRGRGRGRMRGPVFTQQANIDLCATGQSHCVGRKRGRGKDEQGTDMCQYAESTVAGPGGAGSDNEIEHWETGGEKHYLRARGCGTHVVTGVDEVNLNETKAGTGDVWTVNSEKDADLSKKNRKTANKTAAEDALDTPDDNDVLRPVKALANRRRESRAMEMPFREVAVPRASNSLFVRAMDKEDNATITIEEEPQVSQPGVISSGSQMGIVEESVDNKMGVKSMDSEVNHWSGEAPELEHMDNISGECLSSATLGTSTVGAQQNDVELKLANGSNGVPDEDTLSDIDDNELIGYMNNDEEVRLKTIIWTEMNKEYIQEQEAKESALAAMEQARAAAVAAAASNSASAAELAAAAAAAVAQMKKDRKQKRVDDAMRPPAQSAAEATRQMLESKRLSTKVDYTVLAKLFDTDESRNLGRTGKTSQDEDVDSEGPNRSSKRSRFGSQADGSQADSVITQVSARRYLMREVDSKEGSVGVVDMNEEDEGDMDEEDEVMGEGGEVEVEGLPYEYDEADDYYEEY